MKPKNSTDEITVFVKCINFLLKDVAEFKFLKWEAQNFGSFTQQFVVMQIHPPTG